MTTQTDDQKAKAAAEAQALDAKKAQEAQDAAEAQAQAEAEAARPLDETVPGGRYVVNGVTVDADGEPVEG